MAKEKSNFDRYKTSDEMFAAAAELSAALKQLRRDARQLEAEETAERERLARETELRENAELGKLSREIMIGNTSFYEILKMPEEDRQNFFARVMEALEMVEAAKRRHFNNGGMQVYEFLQKIVREDRETAAENN